MENLAGRQDCDKNIKQELSRCGIEILTLPGKLQGEVPASIIGRLGRFSFKRIWDYWLAEGLVPLWVARELYADSVGRTDIRVEGHCGCPPPEKPWITWIRKKDGKKLIPLKEKEEMVRLFSADVLKGFLENCDFSEDPSMEGEGFIAHYHIDSEIGLRIFADTLKKYGLV